MGKDHDLAGRAGPGDERHPEDGPAGQVEAAVELRQGGIEDRPAPVWVLAGEVEV